jgi:hypothetical protein
MEIDQVFGTCLVFAFHFRIFPTADFFNQQAVLLLTDFGEIQPPAFI